MLTTDTASRHVVGVQVVQELLTKGWAVVDGALTAAQAAQAVADASQLRALGLLHTGKQAGISPWVWDSRRGLFL